MVGTWKCGSLKEELFPNIRWGFCIATYWLESSLKHILIAVMKKTASCYLAGIGLRVAGFNNHWLASFLAWIESGWQATIVDKQPLVGSLHILLCQHCDRRDAEWHCHQLCQRPVTFAPVVWEWWRRELQQRTHTERKGRKDKQSK